MLSCTRRNQPRWLDIGQLYSGVLGEPTLFLILLTNMSLLFSSQWRGIRGLTQLTFIADPLKKVSIALDLIFPKRWLDERAEFDPHAEQNGNTEDNKMGKTNYDVEKEVSSRLSLPSTLRGSEW